MATTLAGNTLPDPQACEVEDTYRGGVVVVASGKTVHDLVDTSAKKMWKLSFVNVSSSQLATIRTAFGAVKNTTGTFVPPDGGSYTVTRPEGGRITARLKKIAAGIVYDVSFDLIED
jgi:hypothetical protein